MIRPHCVITATPGTQARAITTSTDAALLRRRLRTRPRARTAGRLGGSAEPDSSTPSGTARSCGSLRTRLPAALDDYVVCPPHTARVVYQGQLAPTQSVRMFLPPPGPATTGERADHRDVLHRLPHRPPGTAQLHHQRVPTLCPPPHGRLSPSGSVPKSELFFQDRDYMSEPERCADATNEKPANTRPRPSKQTASNVPPSTYATSSAWATSHRIPTRKCPTPLSSR